MLFLVQKLILRGILGRFYLQALCIGPRSYLLVNTNHIYHFSLGEKRNGGKKLKPRTFHGFVWKYAQTNHGVFLRRTNLRLLLSKPASLPTVCRSPREVNLDPFSCLSNWKCRQEEQTKGDN